MLLLYFTASVLFVFVEHKPPCTVYPSSSGFKWCLYCKVWSCTCVDFGKAQITTNVYCSLTIVLKWKNRHVNVLCSCLCLFVWRISIFKYCMKHSCCIVALLARVMCWCHLLCWDSYCSTIHLGTSKPLSSM